MKFIIYLYLIFGTVSFAMAQSVSLVSSGEPKPFSLQLYYGTEGRGALVQYKGQADVIALKPERQSTDKGNNRSYWWQEIISNKITGWYFLKERDGKVIEAWYVRGKDHRKFFFKQENQGNNLQQMQKYLLHGALISFTTASLDEQFTVTYPDKKTISYSLPSLDALNARRKGYLQDYNFDGFLDLAFSLPDAGMGVYQTFSIWLYDPLKKRFVSLTAPDNPRAKCNGFNDVTLDSKNKILRTACRGGARWWQDQYRFSGFNRLIWLSSGEKQE